MSGFLQNAKARVFLALGIIVVVIAAVVLFLYWRSERALDQPAISVAGAPNVSSIAGKKKTSTFYDETLQKSDASQAQAAIKEGGSSVPTLSDQPGGFNDLGQFGEAPAITGCPIQKSVVMFRPNPANCAPENLERARDSGVTAEELLCQGCMCPALKMAGYTVGNLKQIGLTATQLKQCGFSLQDLVDAGFSAAELKDAGYTAAQLKNAGFSAAEL